MLDSEGAGRVVTVKTGPLAETGFRKQFLHELSCIMPGPDELHQPPLDFLQGLSSRVPQPWASTGPPPAIPHAICVHLGWCGHAAAAAHGSLAGRWTWAYPCPPPWAYVCPDDVHRRAGAPGALLRPQPQLPVARVHTASAREWHCALQWLTQIRRPRWQLATVTARHLLKDRCSALIEQPST